MNAALSQTFTDLAVLERYLRLILLQVLKTKPGSTFHFGLVCSSWVALCRYSSGRRFLCPHGDESLGWVRNANVMVARLLAYELDELHGYAMCVSLTPVSLICGVVQVYTFGMAPGVHRMPLDT